MPLELVVVELEEPLPVPLGDELGLVPELPDVVPLEPEDPALEPLDGWLPEPLEVPLLGVSSCTIGFGAGPVVVVFGPSAVVGGLTALPSDGSTTFG